MEKQIFMDSSFLYSSQSMYGVPMAGAESLPLAGFPYLIRKK